MGAPVSNAGEVTPNGGGGAVEVVVSGCAVVDAVADANVEVVLSSLVSSAGEQATIRRATTSNRRIENNLPPLH
jgi:hypothetical protein